MKVIKITGTRFIVFDEKQYNVATKKKDKEGKDVYNYVSYHSTLKSALRAIINAEVYDSLPDGENCLQQFLREVDRVSAEVEKAIDGVGEM